MSDRKPTDAEVERLARECFHKYWSRDGQWLVYPVIGTREDIMWRGLARHLIENRGCQVPEDPVLVQLEEVCEEACRNIGRGNGGAYIAEAVAARFHVTPKEDSDA